MKSLRMLSLICLMAIVIAPVALAQSTPTQGYLLWTKSTTGQGAIWRVNPNDGILDGGFYLGPSTGLGGGWEVTRFIPVSPTLGYVLFTRSATGQAAIWTIDPSTGTLTGVTPLSWTGKGFDPQWKEHTFFRTPRVRHIRGWSDDGECCRSLR